MVTNMSGRLTELGNFKFERVKKRYIAFPEVKEYKNHPTQFHVRGNY